MTDTVYAAIIGVVGALIVALISAALTDPNNTRAQRVRIFVRSYIASFIVLFIATIIYLSSRPPTSPTSPTATVVAFTQTPSTNLIIPLTLELPTTFPTSLPMNTMTPIPPTDTLTPSPTSTPEMLSPSITPIEPTISPTTVTGINSPVAYDFEDSTTQGWDTSEGQYKLATLQSVPDPVNEKNHVLQVMTKLTGDMNPDNEVYRHTDAKVYFTQRMPIGFSNPPPYNFQGKQVSCQVYLPQGLSSGSPLPTVNISVKDASQRNDNGKPRSIDASITGKWITLSFIVGEHLEDADQGFDGTHSISVGVQVVVPQGSTLNYTGPFYIDNCTLPH